MSEFPDHPKASGIEELFTSTRKELFFLHLVVSYFLGLPLVDFIAGLLSPGKIGPEDTVKLVAVFVVTAPLAIAVAITVGFAFFQRAPHHVAIAVVGFIAFFLCTLVGNEIYEDRTVYPLSQPISGPFGPMLSYLKGYLLVYGPALFMSALAIGAYLGWKAVVVFHLKEPE